MRCKGWRRSVFNLILLVDLKKANIREELTPSSSRHGEYSEGIVAFDLDSENSEGMKPARGPPVFGKYRPAEAGVSGEVRATSPGESSVAHAASSNTACSFVSITATRLLTCFSLLNYYLVTLKLSLDNHNIIHLSGLLSKIT